MKKIRCLYCEKEFISETAIEGVGLAVCSMKCMGDLLIEQADWLKINPGCTPTDYYKYLAEQNRGEGQ